MNNNIDFNKVFKEIFRKQTNLDTETLLDVFFNSFNQNVNLIFFCGLLLYVIGLWGIFMARKNLIITLISIELLLMGCNLIFMGISHLLDDISGQLFILFSLTVGAGEIAIGLAIVVLYYRRRGVLAIDIISAMKG